MDLGIINVKNFTLLPSMPMASLLWCMGEEKQRPYLENKKELVILQQTESWVTCLCQMELACQQETMNYFPRIGICNFLQESQV